MRFLIILFLFSSTLLAQKPVELKVNLRDGNTITGTAVLSKVSLVSEFGNLDIPFSKINSIEIGTGLDNSLNDKVSKLVNQLSNSNEEMRKSAYNELLSLPITCISLINNFTSSDKYITSTFEDYTIESALNGLISTYNLNSSVSAEDVLSLENGNIISGLYDLKKIDLKTQYGSLSIPKSDIHSIDVLYAGDAETKSDLSFKVNASKNISSNLNGGWVKTNINVKAGQLINISATGEVTLASLSNAKYKPDGSVSGTSYIADNFYDTGAYPTYGNLVFKIGENGTMLKAGSKYSATAATGGIIYLSIYESVFNAANSGSYNVKVSVK